NTFMLGIAYQSGALPIAAAAIEEAIELNGAAVEANVQAFRRGRQYVADPHRLQDAAADADAGAGAAESDPWEALPGEDELARLLRTRSVDLIDYQDQKYAQQYRQTVQRVAQHEQKVTPERTDLAEAAA